MSFVPQPANPNPNVVPPQLVLEHLERVLSSQAFARSERMKRFLRFTVEQVLAGKAEELKEYSVAVRVFDKPEDFDPRLDPIVRVEAGRLRSKLREYYDTEGRQDTVRITIRKRCYVPEFEWRGPERAATAAEERPPSPEELPQPELTSIAVLPFIDLSPRNDQRHLCDGITDEVLNTLSRVEGLRVASRTSAMLYRGAALDVREIGARLNAGSVLEGSVRRHGRKLRVMAQLAGVADGYQLWSEVYDRNITDIFEVQRDISDSIVKALRVRLVDEPRATAPGQQRTSDTAAYESYLQGRYWWTRRRRDDLRKAVRFFDRAVQKDPNYVLACVGLADSHALLGWHGAQPAEAHWETAMKTAERALALDERLGPAWASLALVKAAWEWRWEEAERAFERAIELDPGYATAHQWYAVYCLAPQQRLHHALFHIRRAEELDPLSPVICAHVARILYFRREFDAAVEQCRKALRLDPAFYLTQLYLGAAQEQRCRFDEALTAYEAAAELAGPEPVISGLMAGCKARMGIQSEAAALVSELRKQEKRKRASPLDLAAACVALGDHGAAFEYLAKACDARCARLVHVRVDPVFDPLKPDPRLLPILRRLALDR